MATANVEMADVATAEMAMTSVAPVQGSGSAYRGAAVT